MVDALLALVVGGACTALITRARYGTTSVAERRRRLKLVEENERLRTLNAAYAEAFALDRVIIQRLADACARRREERDEAQRLLADELRKKVA